MRHEIKSAITNAPDDQVDLGEMVVRDDELEEIFELMANIRPDVKELFLNNNIITDVGARALTDGLSTLKKLERVDLQFNKIGINGFAIIYEKETNLKYAVAGNKVVDHSELDAVKKTSYKF